MDVKELQIGDWVLAHFTYPSKVTEIRANGSICTDLDGRQIDDTDFEPIPLTAKILELNGFKKFESKTYAPFYYIKGLTLRWHCYGKYFYINSDDVDIRITEVHELQHALRLCGLWDLADNFKVK